MQRPQIKSKTSNSPLNLSTDSLSKAAGDIVAFPARKKLSQQSIRQFKIQIDHEIAKCLDTLDRQGLKFLKQTLKTSNLFNSINFEVDQLSVDGSTESPKLSFEQQFKQNFPHNFFSKSQKPQQKQRQKMKPLQNGGKSQKISKQQNSIPQSEKTKKSHLKQPHSQLQGPEKNINKPKEFDEKEGKMTNIKKIQNKISWPNSSIKLRAKPNQSYRAQNGNKKNQIVQFESSKTKHFIESQKADNSKISYESEKNHINSTMSGLNHINSTMSGLKKEFPPSVNANSRVVKKTVIQNKTTNETISLGERINKKMQELNISKVGPSKKIQAQVDKPSTHSIEQVKAPDQTIEEIIESVQNQTPESSVRGNASLILVQDEQRSDSISQQEQIHQSIKLGHKINPLKPSIKMPLEKGPADFANFSQANHQNMPTSYVQSRVLQKNIEQSFIDKLSASIQVDDSQFNQNLSLNSEQAEKSIKMSIIVQKINKLSPQKFIEVQKYLEYIQKISDQVDKTRFPQNHETQIDHEKKYQNKIQQNSIHENIKTLHTLLSQFDPTKIQTQTFHPSTHLDNANQKKKIESKNLHTEFIQMFTTTKTQLRKANHQKKEKASFIFGNNSKSASRSRIKPALDFQKSQESNLRLQKNEQYSVKNRNYLQFKNEPDKADLREQKSLNIQKIYFSENEQENEKFENESSKVDKFADEKVELLSSSLTLRKESKLSFPNQAQAVEQGQENRIKLTESELKTNQSQVKMLNLSTKKTFENRPADNRTKLKFKILSNRGHSSLFGLNGIELFTIERKKVTVFEKDLNQNQASIAKLLYLFNGDHHTIKPQNIYQSSITKNQIIVELDKQNQRIGGILIFNFKKNSLESEKEVNEMEIYHNDTKIWRGTLEGNLTSQVTAFPTKIQFVSDFIFPSLGSENQLSLSSNKKFSSNQFSQTFNQTNTPQQKFTEKEEAGKVEETNKKNPNPRSYFPDSANSVKINESIAEKANYQESNSLKNIQLSDSTLQIKSRPLKNQDFSKQKVQTATPSALNLQKKNNYEEFDTMLKDFEESIQREKSKSRILQVSTDFVGAKSKSLQKYSKRESDRNGSLERLHNNLNSAGIKLPKEQKGVNKQFQDFANASIFQQKQKNSLKSFPNQAIKENNISKENKELNIDDFLGQLEEAIQNKGEIAKIKQPFKQFRIPNLPQGFNLEIQIFQNWGHQAYVGLQAIQFFNQEGEIVKPLKIQSNKTLEGSNLLEIINTNNIMNRDEKIQAKLGFDKGSTTVLTFNFKLSISFSLIRIWNYNGHRVHSNMGTKRCLIKIDGKDVFMGDFKRNQSTAETFYKNFQAIVFTEDPKILKMIKQKDWLQDFKRKNKQQKDLFKSTLINFNRPKTKNSEQKDCFEQKLPLKQNIDQKKIKIPKRQCWQCETPQMPDGKVILLLLHDTWGDQNFIGLNGIQIFDGQGKVIKSQQIQSIKAFPNSTGEKNEKRVVENLLNGNNLSSSDGNIWLSTFQSDLQKVESGKANNIMIFLKKSTKISGINIYNYSKTPHRGVREIEILINHFIAFRGYTKIFDHSNPQNALHTTICFTKNIELLAKMNYEFYNEDSIGQNVTYLNQKKLLKVV